MGNKCNDEYLDMVINIPVSHTICHSKSMHHSRKSLANDLTFEKRFVILLFAISQILFYMSWTYLEFYS